MKIETKTLGWIRHYQVSERLYEKIYLEDSYPKEMPDDECYDDLLNRIEAQARRQYPHLFETKSFMQEIREHENPTLLTPPVSTEKFTETEQEQNTLTCINECKDVKILMAFTKIKDKWPSTKSAYNKKYKELAK
jgi:hypothetical protein